MDLNDILKLESQGKLRDAVFAMGTELKARDQIIGTLSDTVVTLSKLKDTVIASAAVSAPAAAVLPDTTPAPETTPVPDTTPAPTVPETTPPVSDADRIATLQKENDELKAKLTPATSPATDTPPAPETPPASTTPVPETTPPAAVPSTETTEPTTTTDVSHSHGSDVTKTVSLAAALRGHKASDVKAGNTSVRLDKFL